MEQTYMVAIIGEDILKDIFEENIPLFERFILS